eukprot:1096869-Pleurochrysis_carterae.AAC.1
MLADPLLLCTARRELAGKRLGCWCHAPPCHCRTLAAVANCAEDELAMLLVDAGPISDAAK